LGGSPPESMLYDRKFDIVPEASTDREIASMRLQRKKYPQKHLKVSIFVCSRNRKTNMRRMSAVITL
jgi:hypothetical protein